MQHTLHSNAGERNRRKRSHIQFGTQHQRDTSVNEAESTCFTPSHRICSRITTMSTETKEQTSLLCLCFEPFSVKAVTV
jgi:hypothetical protein